MIYNFIEYVEAEVMVPQQIFLRYGRPVDDEDLTGVCGIMLDRVEAGQMITNIWRNQLPPRKSF